MPLIQKYFGWLQRFLYQTEALSPAWQASDTLVGTIDATHDWPLDTRPITIPFTTIVGVVPLELLRTSGEQHALVYLLSVAKVAAGAWAFGDGLTVAVSVGGVSVTVAQINAEAYDTIPLIRTIANFQAGAGVITHSHLGAEPLYIGPGEVLTLGFQSAGAGTTGIVTGAAIVLPKSHPLRLP